RNINRCKISDSSILVLLIWQASLSVESQRRFCEKLVNLSHSRFNRRARMLLPLLYFIRHGLNEEVDLSGDILIIDSVRVPVCQPIRSRRVVICRSSAAIGYQGTTNAIIRVVRFTLVLATTGSGEIIS